MPDGQSLTDQLTRSPLDANSPMKTGQHYQRPELVRGLVECAIDAIPAHRKTGEDNLPGVDRVVGDNSPLLAPTTSLMLQVTDATRYP